MGLPVQSASRVLESKATTTFRGSFDLTLLCFLLCTLYMVDGSHRRCANAWPRHFFAAGCSERFFMKNVLAYHAVITICDMIGVHNAYHINLVSRELAATATSQWV